MRTSPKATKGLLNFVETWLLRTLLSRCLSRQDVALLAGMGDRTLRCRTTEMNISRWQKDIAPPTQEDANRILQLIPREQIKYFLLHVPIDMTVFDPSAIKSKGEADGEETRATGAETPAA